MKCPICHSHSLTEVSLDTGLLARQCRQCFGHWISSQSYWEWLDHREHQIKEHSRGQLEGQTGGQTTHQPPISINEGGNLLPVADNTTANFCLDCDRLMTKAKVGRGLSFYLDRCSHCHGVWLDQNEWENLRQLELHHQIHYMFSSAWQFSVRKEGAIYQRRVPQQASQKTPA